MPKTILLAEDNNDAREVMKLCLEMLGYKVLEATNGLEAVEIAKDDDFDLVLMDIAMPIMDGITATREIKQIEKTSEIPIIAVTGHSNKYQDEALKAGMIEIVEKPVSINDLQPILASYLNR